MRAAKKPGAGGIDCGCDESVWAHLGWVAGRVRGNACRRATHRQRSGGGDRQACVATRGGHHPDLQGPPGKEIGGAKVGIGAWVQVDYDTFAAFTGDQKHETL